MNICVIGGAGYVGLVTGLGLAEISHRVVNVDVDRERVCRLNAGDSAIYEEGIGPVLRRNLDAGRIRFTTNLAEGLAESEVIFIAVGTPSRQDGQADLYHGIRVAEELSHHLDSYKMILVKSTVPVGFEVINLGGDRPVALAVVIKMLEELLGRNAHVQRNPALAADVQATWADISLAKRVLAWNPGTTLQEGLGRVMEWYQQNRDWAKEMRIW